ncbi:MAG: DUF1614 domain-containing protein [Candidatus Kuenenia sp.]|nr:DUF1614 domain-containing protein [Candidatus Kuenenia hertensis]
MRPPTIIPWGCLPVAIFLFLLILFPLFLANVMLSALVKLGLSPDVSVVVAMAIFIGGMINIPIKQIPRKEVIDVKRFEMFGFHRILPQMVQHRRYTIIAVNVGGCIVPCIIVIYELVRILQKGEYALMVTVISVIINIAVCYYFARPIPGVGIALPPLIPALVAAACGFMLNRELAPLTAFISGVMGPLVGADLLHLRKIQDTLTGIASIGGAGTFDGIVISGLAATLLA